MTNVLKCEYAKEPNNDAASTDSSLLRSSLQLLSIEKSPWPGLFKSVLVEVIWVVLMDLQVSDWMANAYKLDTFYMYRLQRHGTLRLCIKLHTSKKAPWTGGIYRYFVLRNWSPTCLFIVKWVKSKYVLGLHFLCTKNWMVQVLQKYKTDM